MCIRDSLDSAVTHLIEIRKEQLKRIEQGLEDIQSGSKYSTPVEKNSPDDEPKFAVLKERVHIMKRIEKMAESSQDEIVLTLGKFGILHLCRSSALQAVNEAASRGVKRARPVGVAARARLDEHLHVSQMTSRKLHATCYRLPATSYKLQVTGYMHELG